MRVGDPSLRGRLCQLRPIIWWRRAVDCPSRLHHIRMKTGRWPASPMKVGIVSPRSGVGIPKRHGCGTNPLELGGYTNRQRPIRINDSCRCHKNGVRPYRVPGIGPHLVCPTLDSGGTMFLAILFYVGLFAFLAVAIFGQQLPKGVTPSTSASTQKQPEPDSKTVPGVAISGGLVGLAVVLALAWGGSYYGRGNEIFPRNSSNPTTWTASTTSYGPDQGLRPYYGGGYHTVSHGGHYAGGIGSSHRGGNYVSPSGGHHYGRHK